MRFGYRLAAEVATVVVLLALAFLGPLVFAKIARERTVISPAVSIAGFREPYAGSESLNAITRAEIDGREVLVAVGEGGLVLTTAGDRVWLRQETPTQSELLGIANGPGGLVAVGSGGTAILSKDALNWQGGRTGGKEMLYAVTA